MNVPVFRLCCMTVQQGVWWRRADETGVVQDDSYYSRCSLWHPTWCLV